jgi:truncated hemoglobin YjbI
VLLGGDGAYTGRDLRQAHADLDLDERDFEAFLDHLSHALTAMDTPNDVAAQVEAAFASLRGHLLGD